VVLPSVRSDTAFASDGKPKRSEMRVGTLGLLIRNGGEFTSCLCLNKKPGIAVGLPATTSGSRALAHPESTVRGNEKKKKKKVEHGAGSRQIPGFEKRAERATRNWELLPLPVRWPARDQSKACRGTGLAPDKAAANSRRRIRDFNRGSPLESNITAASL